LLPTHIGTERWYKRQLWLNLGNILRTVSITSVEKYLKTFAQHLENENGRSLSGLKTSPMLAPDLPPNLCDVKKYSGQPENNYRAAR
jgi:hypothetical protein